ncbi:6-phosphogluconolactonase [Buchnera aphidicola]|uniref:6-phosphogluconolactonase n=1 Tax=Buchnera aphidicola TaxID=9 RepID=UPI003BEF494D
MKQIIYIAIPEKNIIEAWNLNKNGILQLIQKINTDGQVQPMNIIKNNNFLYVGIRPNNRIIIYSIKKNGFLELINEKSIPGSPNYISFDSQKKFLFCSSYHMNCLSILPLDNNYMIQEPIKTIYNIQGCHAAKINQKYNILIVTALKEDCLYLYYFNNKGTIKSTEQKCIYTEKNSGPRHIAIHPNQDYIYTVNEINGTIDIWNIYQNKNIIKIKKIQNINLFSAKLQDFFWAADIHITSCGRFLYASDRSSNTINLFHIQSDNTIVFYHYYITEKQPRSFCIDQYNKYLIVTGQKSNTFTIYSISFYTGELTKLNTYYTSQGALWICTHLLN